MKHLAILLLLGLFTKNSFSQSNHPDLLFGKYEGIEIRYLKHVTDTTNKIDRMNETWGKKTLTLDSNGTFLLEFPVPYPTTAMGLKRSAAGRWKRINDTLILDSYKPYSAYIKVKEKKDNHKNIQVKLKYTHNGKKYYPGLSIRINNREEQMIDTRDKKWISLPLDTVKKITIEHWAGPTSTDREWVYKTKNIESNSFEIIVKDSDAKTNFVLEDYKLLITDSALMQIDKVFRLSENRFKFKNFR